MKKRLLPIRCQQQLIQLQKIHISSVAWGFHNLNCSIPNIRYFIKLLLVALKSVIYCHCSKKCLCEFTILDHRFFWKHRIFLLWGFKYKRSLGMLKYNIQSWAPCGNSFQDILIDGTDIRNKLLGRTVLFCCLETQILHQNPMGYVLSSHYTEAIQNSWLKTSADDPAVLQEEPYG